MDRGKDRIRHDWVCLVGESLELSGAKCKLHCLSPRWGEFNALGARCKLRCLLPLHSEIDDGSENIMLEI